VRAYDVRTGKLAWTFRTIPQAGEFGNETWENDSWAVNGNTGVWNQISVDEDLGRRRAAPAALDHLFDQPPAPGDADLAVLDSLAIEQGFGPIAIRTR